MIVPFREPSAAGIDAFLERQRTAALSYAAVGATRATPPAGYQVDRHRIQLGSGERTFRRAVDALRRWEMFNVGWITVRPERAPIEAGTNVAVLVRHFGFRSMNACRIVYVVDEPAPSARCGFAYGTLADHMESGEERFTIEWHRADDGVWYDLLAFSRPRHALARAAYPLSRRLQRRFARDSLRAMRRAATISGPREE